MTTLANCFLSQVWNIWSIFLATLSRCLFCSSVNRCGTHLAKIFRSFKCFFKIRWIIHSDMPTFRAISRTVNLAFPSMISFIFETISWCKFWPTWFGCIFDGPYTRFSFIFPAPNCVLRHTRRSLSSRKFSHQLLQRTTKFWASSNVSLYFIFLVVRRMAENEFAPPPREFCRHILSCREWKAASFKRCLHSVLRGVSL